MSWTSPPALPAPYHCKMRKAWNSQIRRKRTPSLAFIARYPAGDGSGDSLGSHRYFGGKGAGVFQGLRTRESCNLHAGGGFRNRIPAGIHHLPRFPRNFRPKCNPPESASHSLLDSARQSGSGSLPSRHPGIACGQHSLRGRVSCRKRRSLSREERIITTN